METGKTDTRSRMDLPDGCWLEMECNRKIYEKQGLTAGRGVIIMTNLLEE